MIYRLEAILKRYQASLNRRIVTSGALRWASRAAIVSAVVIAALLLAGWSFAPLPPWAALTLSGSLWGAFRALRRRLDSVETARWLDAKYGNGELISAALFCAGRGKQGPFDSTVMERARAFIDAAPTVRPARRIIAKQAAFTLAALMILPLGLAVLPIPRPNPSASGDGRAVAPLADNSDKPAGDASGELDERSPDSIARNLFPDERRLAAIAERMIREGRLDDLKDILNRAELDYRDRIKRANSALERSRLTEELEQFQQSGREALGQNPGSQGNEAKGPGDSAANAESAGNRQSNGVANGTPTHASKGVTEDQAPKIARRPPPWMGAEANQGIPDQDETDGAGMGGKSGDNTAGTDGSGELMAWDRIERDSSGKTILKNDPEKDRLFELVMSENSPTLGGGNVSVRSGRVTEAAVSREAAPMDYEEYIRSYFISLSKLVNSAESPAEDGLGGKGVQQ